METTPLETFISPRKEKEDARQLKHRLFGRLMARADIGFEDPSVVKQVLTEADSVDIAYITGCMDRWPDKHLEDFINPVQDTAPPQEETSSQLVSSSAA